MTRAEVIAIMGTPPVTVEGGDHGRLIWLDTTATPWSYRDQRVDFHFDERGRVYGRPEAARADRPHPGSD